MLPTTVVNLFRKIGGAPSSRPPLAAPPYTLAARAFAAVPRQTPTRPAGGPTAAGAKK
jgi:hypothetical protein